MTNAPRIVRYAFGERLVHALAGLSYLYLLLTGLAFWTPALYWLAIVLGGGYLSRLVHPWMGLVFSGACCGCTYLARRDAHDGRDRAWRKALLHLPPERGCPGTWCLAFQLRQKLLLVDAVGGSRIAAVGLVLWFVDSIPWELRSLRTSPQSFTRSRPCHDTGASSFMSTWERQSCQVGSAR